MIGRCVGDVGRYKMKDDSLKGMQKALKSERAKRQEAEKDMVKMADLKNFNQIMDEVDQKHPTPPSSVDEQLERLLQYVDGYYAQENVPSAMKAAKQWDLVLGAFCWKMFDRFRADLDIRLVDDLALAHCPFKGIQQVVAKQYQDAAEFREALDEMGISPTEALQLNTRVVKDVIND